jgi:hypothetical protein
MKITPEEVYSLWHKEINKAKGRNVRKVKNFDKAKEKEDWKYFELCSNLINKSQGHVDPNIYIKSIAEHYEGYFQPKLLISRKSIKIYNLHNKIVNLNTSEEFIIESIKKSIKFIVKYCRENDIKNLYDYLSEGSILIPTPLKHLSAGSISLYFLFSIPNIKIVLGGYPKDSINEYIKNLDEDFNTHRSRIMAYSSTRKISKNLEEIIFKLINK